MLSILLKKILNLSTFWQFLQSDVFNTKCFRMKQILGKKSTVHWVCKTWREMSANSFFQRLWVLAISYHFLIWSTVLKKKPRVEVLENIPLCTKVCVCDCTYQEACVIYRWISTLVGMILMAKMAASTKSTSSILLPISVVSFFKTVDQINKWPLIANTQRCWKNEFADIFLMFSHTQCTVDFLPSVRFILKHLVFDASFPKNCQNVDKFKMFLNKINGL